MKHASQAISDAGLAAKAYLQAKNAPGSDPEEVQALLCTYHRKDSEAENACEEQFSAPAFKTKRRRHLDMLTDIRLQVDAAS